MAILKSPYEISLWEDVLVFVVEAEDSSIIKYERSLPSDVQGQVIAQYYKEKKIFNIGSDTSESPIRVVNSKFNCKTNGEKTLTFDIYSQYYDEETGSFQPNPYIGWLTNERKIKLKHKDKWHDLIIKNVQENYETKVYSYTAKDIFVNELSKSGFNLEFNSELENNIGDLQILAERVMNGTDWEVDAVGLLKQIKEEPLCAIVLAENIEAKKIEDREQTVYIPEDSTIYAFYSDVVSQSSSIQFLVPPAEGFKINEDHVVVNAENLIIEGVSWNTNEDIDGNITSYWPEFAQTSQNTFELRVSTEYRGKKLVITQDSEFDAFLGKYVDIYEDIDIDPSEEGVQIISPRGFIEYEYITPAVVQSYITNAKNYESTNGWHGCAEEGTELAPNVEITSIPNIRDIVENFEEIATTGIESYLQVDITDKDNQALFNSGIVDHRKQINGFVNGQKYLFRIDCGLGIKDEGKDYISGIDLEANNVSGSIKICEYTISNGKYIYDEDAVYFNGNFAHIEENRYGCELTCGLSLSYEDMLSKGNTLGLFIKFNDNQTYLIKEVQFFQKVEINGEILTLETPVSEETAQIKTWYCYYDKNSEYTNLDNLTYLYRDTEPNTTYRPQYTDGGYTKTRTLNASESNRFNLLQNLCELFEVWVELYAEHESNGAIALDENYCQKKHVRFYEDRTQNNYVGFKYGRDLKSIQRTVESDGIVSKLIVKNNSNEYATDGFCSIARSKENPSRENFIIDFGYYIRQQMLDLSTVTNDLYLDSNGYLGYYKKLKEWNVARDFIIQWQSGLLTTIARLKANYQTYDSLLIEANNQLQDKYAYIYNLTGYTLEDLINQEDASEGQDEGEDTGEEETGEQNDKAAWLENEQVLATLAAIAQLISNITSYKAMVESLEEQLNAAESLNNAYSEQLNELKAQKEELHQKFYDKYSRFLQEGSWISEDYIDDTLYYLDAQSTLYTSAYPKISYEISVLELSHLPGYEDIKFELGDLTTMEDTEFFGWSAQNVPYKEQIVVTEVTYALDSPIDNKIKVQNFKTQFEDLFQRMAATAQNVEFSSGEYRRAADVINADGTINIQTLQSSIENNALILSNANDQSVFWDESGITTVSLTRPSEIVRIVSGGIFLSTDGGVTWTTGITANGINASTITTGQLNTERINILNGSFPSFRWDKDGLSAFEFSYDNTGAPTGFNSSKFIRFDQFGLYGINGHPNFNPLIDDGAVGEDKIKRDANFALTWDGFMLKSSHEGGGYVSITSDNDIQVFDKEDKERVKLGYLDNNNYGLQLKKGNDNIVLQQRSDGTLWVEDVLNIQPGSESYQIKIGHITKLDGEDYDRVITIGEPGVENFIVYEDGSVKANNGYFQGEVHATSGVFTGEIHATSGTFTGTIEATGGQIGGLGVQELVDKVEYQVKIQIIRGANEGDDATSIFEKGTEAKILKAILYKGTNPVEGDPQAFSYQWSKDGQEISNGNGQTIKVEGNQILRSSVYSCKVTYDKPEEDAAEGGT